jgi:NAD/NADP transhydrogenase alpha subunit
MFARNVVALLELVRKDGALTLDMQDDIVQALVMRKNP